MRAMIIAGLAGLLLLGGCAGKGGVKNGEGSESSLGAGGSGATTSGLGQGRGVGGAGAGGGPGSMNDPSNPLSKHVIYFEYDSEQVAAAYQSIVDAHAAYLVSHPAQHVRVAGHTDERGSREYNLALGERRALAVQRTMMLKGVQRAQIDTISYGEEVPAASGHDEESWAQNRRAVIEYSGQ